MGIIAFVMETETELACQNKREIEPTTPMLPHDK